jgi:hypothetical protein
VGDTRPTVELTGPFNSPKPREPRTRYSVKRASTEDERAQLVERVNVVSTVAAREPRWRVEIAGERVWLRSEGVQIELAILRR